MIYEDAKNPQRFHTVSTSDDERFAFLTISDRGKGLDGNALWVLDASKRETKFKPVVAEPGKYDFSVVDNDGDILILETNEGAPNKKLVRVDPTNPAKGNWRTIVAEKPEPLQDVNTVGKRLFLNYSKDVSSRVLIYDYQGAPRGSVTLPGLGNAGGFGGEKEDKFTFYTYSSFNFPPTIYRYDIAEISLPCSVNQVYLLIRRIIPSFKNSIHQKMALKFRCLL